MNIDNTSASDADAAFLRRAIELARNAELAGDVPVGAILCIGELSIESWNCKEAKHDPTAHAELLAIVEAAQRLGRWRLSDATLYITKEPCVMCAGAIIAARIGRVVYAASDPKGGADGGTFDILRSPKTNHHPVVEAGLLEEEASAQLVAFFRSRRASARAIPEA
ncbi:MAG TPA: tRNA adenosine(34) deaminase TadA [Candidatus Dormibacteraeota bacterium]|nr:tRNA adenosine(34) deaminase TadA [Candidatus Dormibacteraeota bacterium]